MAKFCINFNLVKSVSVRHCMLQEFKKDSPTMEMPRNIHSVYRNKVLNVWKYQWWFNQSFDQKKFSLKDCPWPGQPSSVNTELVQTIVEENSKQTVKEFTKRHTWHTHLWTLNFLPKSKNNGYFTFTCSIMQHGHRGTAWWLAQQEPPLDLVIESHPGLGKTFTDLFNDDVRSSLSLSPSSLYHSL